MTDRIIAFSILCLVFGLPLGVAALFTGELILDFVFFWPLFMSVLWITGGLYFWFQLERHWSWDKDTPAPTLAGEPLISILIPCFNEGRNARETISAALDQRYENIEVIAINDGSSDNTAQVLQELAQEQPRLRVINLAENQGKRWRSRPGQRRRGDLLVCIDGDALLDRDTAAYLVAPLIQYPHVGAVTGNPRIRTRSTLIGRIQVGEFSSIIGLIKRTQRIYGRVFTVSGVIAAFRRQALADVGYWSPDMITEDIDISWKLQLRHWDIFFEPRALCWILMPETLRACGNSVCAGPRGRGGVSGQPSQDCALGASPHVAAVSGVRAVNAVGLRVRDDGAAVPPQPCRACSRQADRGEPFSTGVYRAAAGRDVPAAVPGQLVHRAAL
jgi:biofilm PGA synthesis N-glycosyltransferase PgaC